MKNIRIARLNGGFNEEESEKPKQKEPEKCLIFIILYKDINHVYRFGGIQK